MTNNYFKLTVWGRVSPTVNGHVPRVVRERFVFFDDRIPESVDDALRAVWKAGRDEHASVHTALVGPIQFPVIGEFPPEDAGALS